MRQSVGFRPAVLNWGEFLLPPIPEYAHQFMQKFLLIPTGKEMLLVSSAERPDMLLNILQCRSQPPG